MSFTPPDRTATLSGDPVRRRHVFYIPGYDPEASRRYRALFVREFTRYAKRFDVPRRKVSPASNSTDGLAQTWTVEIDHHEWSTLTLYEVLLWDDLVKGDGRRWIVTRMVLMTIAFLHAVASRMLFRSYRLSPRYGNVMLYPFVVMLLLLGGSGGLGALCGWIAASFGIPAWLCALGGAAIAVGTFLLVAPRLDRFFVWQLLNDWIFNWQHGQGWRPDYQDRLTRFSERVVQRVRDFGADEVVIIGHSTGALTAVEICRRALDLDPGLGTGRPVALVTLGSGLPLVALQPAAHQVRDDVLALVTSDRAVWVDYQAPQDWMNFPGFNPLRELDFREEPRPVLNPYVRSARFKDIVEPETYEKILFKPFRLHFQFLMSNDLPGEYDFFALTLGGQRLLDRLLLPSIVQRRAAAALPTDAA